MKHNRLLAKSFDRNGHPTEPPSYALLSQHTRDVVDAGDALLSWIGRLALDNAAIPPTRFRSFARAVQLNTWLQDLGKANTHFQEMVTASPQLQQILRHETVSVIIATRPDFRSWLTSVFSDEEYYAGLWGAAGHHRKFSKHRCKPQETPPLQVKLNHADFKAIIAEMCGRLGPPEARIDFRSYTIGAGRGSSFDLSAIAAIKDLFNEFDEWCGNHDNPGFRRFVGLVKAFGIAADVCASAVARRDVADYSMASFVRENLDQGLSSQDFDQLMWRWAWENTEHGFEPPDAPSGFPPNFVFYPFQSNTAKAKSYLTLTQAGCGSGKSLAAYLWGKSWCRKWEEAGKAGFRFIFTLPTTGTTTEHFKEYALTSGVSPALKTLVHSRAAVDLLFEANETAPQEECETSDSKESTGQASQMIAAQRDKIEALELWGTPLVVSTADTVLGLMGNARRSVYSFPAIMQSAIVFDEIHAYDNEMFGHLLMFLENFPRIPVLLMTASLPEARLNAIKKLRPDLDTVPGPPDLENLPRYEPPLLLPEASVWEHIDACLADPNRGKVLWVRNQVGWAVDSYQECFDRLSDPNLFIGLYHSRFRYKDRVKVHRRVIDEFKRKGTPTILIATQVAEMSLPLSADLLITDQASIPSEIQRFGRLNRQSKPKASPCGMSIICEPPSSNGVGKPDHLPYTEKELEKTRTWLKKLTEIGRRLSQRDLIDTFHAIDQGDHVLIDEARKRATFLSGLYETEPASIRGDGMTIAVVLKDDVDSFPNNKKKDYKYKREWLREHEVSIPIRPKIAGWNRFDRTPIALSEDVEYGPIDFDIDPSKLDPRQRTGAAWRDHR